MLGGGAAQLHRHARHGRAISDVFAGFKIISVPNRTGQVFRDILNRGERDGFRKDIQTGRHHHFGVVEECVESLERGIFGWNGCHVGGIDDCKDGLQFRVSIADFFMRLVIADDTAFIDLATGPGRCCNRYDRQRRIRHRETFPGSAVHLVPEPSRICRHGSDGYGGIQNRASA